MVSNHTFGNLMLRPPSVRSLGEGPDARLLAGLGDAMAAAGGLTSQHAYDLYDTTGSAEDWAYWSAGAPGFTPEIGPDTGAGPPDFHPLFESIVPSAYWGTGGRGGMREAYLLALENAADPSRHSVIDGAGPAGSTIELSKTFMTATSPVLQADGTEGPVQTFPDGLRSTMTIPADGRFRLHANPSTRPIAMGRDGREPAGPTTPAVSFTSPGDTVSHGSGDPATADPESYRDFPFTVRPGDDDATATARITWRSAADDWDLAVFRRSADPGVPDTQLGVSQQAGTTWEQVTVYGRTDDAALEPGDLYARVVDYETTDKRFDGTVTFAGPTPAVPPTPESWTLRCLAPGGQVLGERTVRIDRGEQADVGDACPIATWLASLGGASPVPAPASGDDAGPANTAAGSTPPESPARGVRMAVALDGATLREALRGGVRARVRCAPACLPSAALLADGDLAATGGAAGTRRRTTFRLRFTSAAQRRLAGREQATLRLVAIGLTRDGRRATRRADVTLAGRAQARRVRASPACR